MILLRFANHALYSHAQHGGVLIVGLLLLLIISLVTLASVSIPATQLNLANNSVLQSQALAAAEDGLIDAETTLQKDHSMIPTFDWDTDKEDCLAIYQPDTAPPPWCKLSPDDSAEDGEARLRQYRIQYVGPAGLEMGNGTAMTERYYYRVTGHGEHHTGQRDVESVVVATDLAQPR